MAIANDSFGPTISLDGARKVRGNLTQARIRWMVLALVLGFGLVGGRLVQLGMVVPDSTIEGQARDVITATRPPSKSASAGPVPLYGMCVRSAPDMVLNSSTAR